MKAIPSSFPIFILILLIGSFYSYAQSDTAQDSLSYYIRLTENPLHEQDVTKAFEYFKRMSKRYKKEDEWQQKVYSDYFIARIQKNMGDHNESEKTAIAALAQLDKHDIDDWNGMRLAIYNHLGILHKKRNDWKGAIKNYTIALKYAKNKDKGTLFNNIGNVYKKQEQFETAITYYERAIAIEKENGSVKKLARTLDNLGEVQYKINHPSGLLNLKMALAMRQQDSLVSGIITSYAHLSDYYLNAQMQDSAIIHADIGLELARQSDIEQYVFDALSQKMKAHPDNQVNEYIKKLEEITTNQKKTENAYATSKYNYDKKSEESAQRQRNVYFLITAIIFLIIAVVTGYKVLRLNHRRDKLKEIHNTEARISKKVHDEVANDVYRIMNKIQSSAPSHEILDDIEAVYFKTRDISKETAAIDVLHDFKNELNDLLLTYNTQGVKVITQGVSKIDWKSLDDFKKEALYKVLMELMTNMKKHSKANYVIISFEQLKDKLLINYKDTGQGTTIKKGNGLQNTESRIKAINGTITFESEPSKGFKVKIIV